MFPTDHVVSEEKIFKHFPIGSYVKTMLADSVVLVDTREYIGYNPQGDSDIQGLVSQPLNIPRRNS